MTEQILLTIMEIGVGVIFESIVLGLIFQQLSNRSMSDAQAHIQKEIKKIEEQNKFDFEQMQQEIRSAKSDILSQIKESKSL